MKEQSILDKMLQEELKSGFTKKLALKKTDSIYRSLRNCRIINNGDLNDRRVDSYVLMDIKKLQCEEETPYYVMMFYAGRNGDGNWVEYLNQLAILFHQLESHYENVWMIKLENDCPDDVHYVYIGVQNLKGE